MTCKDCICFDACLDMSPYPSKVNIFLECDFAKDCKHFKDKSRMIELPCKVGDTVYYVHKSEHKITTHKVTNIYVGKSMTISAKGLWSTIKPHEFSWLFYTSKEEAEKALKECEE